jgi:N-acetylneuraminic acid mutarotase
MIDNPRDDHLHEPWQWGVEEISGVACNGRFYVFGAGGLDEVTGGAGVLNYNEMYDPARNEWTSLAKKPTTVSGAVPVAHDGKIYLFGAGGRPQPSYTVEVYDPETDKWEHVTEMPKMLFNMAIAVHDNRAYLIGGYDLDKLETNHEVMAYDFETGDWIRGYCDAAPDAARGYSYATQTPVVNGRAYLVGGAGASQIGQISSLRQAINSPSSTLNPGTGSLALRFRNQETFTSRSFRTILSMSSEAKTIWKIQKTQSLHILYLTLLDHRAHWNSSKNHKTAAKTSGGFSKVRSIQDCGGKSQGNEMEPQINAGEYR